MLFSHKLTPKKAKQLDFFSATRRRRAIKIPLCLSTPVRKSLIKTENQNCQCKAEI